MKRTIISKSLVATSAVLALACGGVAFAAHDAPPSDTDDTTAETVVNRNGHEVDEHAAKGQARAAEARAQRDAVPPADDEAAPEDVPAEDAPAEDAPAEDDDVAPGDNGNHGGPAEQVGDHPDEHADEDHEPQGPKDGKGPQGPQADHEPEGPQDGHGPAEQVGDHPDGHATGAE